MIATVTKKLVFITNADDPSETLPASAGMEVDVTPNERLPKARVDISHEGGTVHNVPAEWFAMVAVYRRAKDLGYEA